MEKRTILAIVLSILVVLIYQVFFMKPPPSKIEPPAQSKPAETTAVTEEAKPTAKVALSKKATPQVTVREKDIFVETPLYTAVFTTRGGALKSLKLKKYLKAIDRPELIELVDLKTGMPRPLTINFPESSIEIALDGVFDTNTPSMNLMENQESRQLIFTLTHPGQIRVEKSYTFHPNRYAVDMEVKVYNLSGNPISQNASLNWYQYVDPKAETDSYAHDGPVTFLANDVERQEVKKLDVPKLLGPNVSWTGFESKYFIAALIAQNPTISGVSMAKDGREMVTLSLRGPKQLIPPGQPGFFSYIIFLGPKDYNILKAQGVGLENAVDFGSWLKWLAMPLLVVLQFLYQYAHNYGIAIIIVTVLIKLLFWPLGNISYRSMKEMQKLQPKIKELQEKFKDDKQRIGKETMSLYKTHKVNPMSGCLPMFIQIPVFFGLYKALLYAIELRHAPFFWWIQDLSAKDPYYVTPIIMGATMFIQQKMTPPAGDPMQQKIMLWLPVIFTFLFLNFPSGLVIYWLFNNVLSIGQQYYVNKKHA